LKTGEFIELDQKKLPGCYYHHSARNDVARTEKLTFICTPTKEEAGPTNNWMAPTEAYQKLSSIFKNAMQGRTLYVIPFIMGPAGSPFGKIGIEITDSLYVVLSMRIMTRMGKIALNQLGSSTDFTKCLHSKADLNIERRFICHFPHDNTIWSVGSGYGGNALLGKKCLALRIASYLGKKENWMAEHMLILGIENPKGEVKYICAAFPSACGKTNLAMLVPPDALPGYKIWTVGDDIAWLRPGPDGRLWAVNPEAGFFGVVPGTSQKTNPSALATIQTNTFFTNVLRTKNGLLWWEGLDDKPPAEGIDWKGESWTPGNGEHGAHPNSRFTAPAFQCPSLSPEWEAPNGVPISAIIFGARRSHVAPLIYQSFSWQHGTFIGATMASQRTAAAEGKVGELRRDPMAMKPFCGYNMGDYFAHWIHMGKIAKNPPAIFHVNWFREDARGKFLWPGFGENLRVLLWALDQCEGKGKAKKTPIGYVPTDDALYLDGLNLDPAVLKQLLEIDRNAWLEETHDQEKFFDRFGSQFPTELIEELKALRQRLTS
ncbi:MAG: phosphoenolpyruvate carboxykinase (GTP), partial [Chlamydiota bacterium]|nr:phosphoenolpyruvate carboxykinase (GTP) [Chlamydiota bacterium]